MSDKLTAIEAYRIFNRDHVGVYDVVGDDVCYVEDGVEEVVMDALKLAALTAHPAVGFEVSLYGDGMDGPNGVAFTVKDDEGDMVEMPWEKVFDMLYPNE